jgi:protein-S-isoprenylcysteine O-methyltransferase Ste14
MLAIIARFRVTLGFVCAGAVLWLAQPSRESLGVGVAIASIGEGLRIWAAGHLHKSREVTVSGPYRWFAHPLYVGSSIIGLGLAVACASLAAAIVIGFYLAVTLSAAIRSEEAFLRRTFGDRYDAYRRGSGSAGRPDEGRRFSMGQAMANHEPRTLAGFALAVLLLVFKATYNAAFWRTAAGR